MYDSEDEDTLDADRVIADDSELAEFEGMSTVTVTVALDPDAKVTELSDLAEAQTPLCPIVKVSSPLPVFVTVNDKSPDSPGFNPVKVPTETVTPDLQLL